MENDIAIVNQLMVISKDLQVRVHFIVYHNKQYHNLYVDADDYKI